jgi:hypothetical protein
MTESDPTVAFSGNNSSFADHAVENVAVAEDGLSI